jgi:hypothetical protein
MLDTMHYTRELGLSRITDHKLDYWYVQTFSKLFKRVKYADGALPKDEFVNTSLGCNVALPVPPGTSKPA